MDFDQTQSDFRSTATIGIGLAAVALLLPFAIINLFVEAYTLAAGALAITAMLLIAVAQVHRGRDHETLTLYLFVPIGALFLLHVFRIDGVVATVWCYPTIVAFYCMLERRRAVAANALLLGVVGPMTLATLDVALAARFWATLLAVSLFANILVREIDEMRRRLHFQIEHDPLTGLLNRHSLAARLDAAIGAAPARPAALLSLDLDHFKTINDRFGHETGDRVLCEVARLLRDHAGERDPVFRIGGEEFLMLLDGQDTAQAVRTAETLRATIAAAGILQHHPVTASIGIAALREGDARAAWMRRSDEHLYAAKRGGRDRVVSTARAAVAPGAPTPMLSVCV